MGLWGKESTSYCKYLRLMNQVRAKPDSNIPPLTAIPLKQLIGSNVCLHEYSALLLSLWEQDIPLVISGAL